MKQSHFIGPITLVLLAAAWLGVFASGAASTEVVSSLSMLSIIAGVMIVLTFR